MLTATMPSLSVATVAAPQLVRPRKNALEEYPLFGVRENVTRLLNPGRAQEVFDWLVHTLLYNRSVHPATLWQLCQMERFEYFRRIWTVTLLKPSRSLAPGTYVFEVATEFIHLPGKPPKVVRECYREAKKDLDHHLFTYLDLLWEKEGHKRVHLAPERLRERAEAETAFFTMKAMETVGWHGSQRMKEHLSFLRKGKTAKVPWKIKTHKFQKQYEYLKYDPVLVVPEPQAMQEFGGKMPLVLIAHWD